MLFEVNHTFTIHANFVRLNNFAISCDASDQIFISTNTLGEKNEGY